MAPTDDRREWAAQKSTTAGQVAGDDGKQYIVYKAGDQISYAEFSKLCPRRAGARSVWTPRFSQISKKKNSGAERGTPVHTSFAHM